jgi:SAM-dependent methyltransferase
MSIVARQFGRPSGVLGRLVGGLMARSNGDFNRWAVQEIRQWSQNGIDGEVERIAELGPGPGVGLEETLQTFPEARVWGVDLSPEMLSQSRRRNIRHVRSGRLTLLEGDAASLAKQAPIDLVIAVHVLYFWHQPAAELVQLHGAMRPGGLLALGYQLREHMPPPARTNFPKRGHLLYDSDDEVTALLRGAGFTSIAVMLKGPPQAPHGRLALATA